MSSHSSNPDQQAKTGAQRVNKDNLLDELESIKDLLEDSYLDDESLDSDLDIDIPILDDMVPLEQADASTAHSNLLDLKSIFDDDVESDTSDPDAATAVQPQDAIAGNIVSGDAGSGDAETQMDFEGLDTDIEIPSFKLAVASEPQSAGEAAAEPAAPLTLDSLADLELPTLHDQAEPATGADWEIPANTAAADTATVPPVPETEPQPLQEAQQVQPAPQAQQAPPSPAVEIDIDFLIQEVVDEVIPMVEDQLRQRLASYPAEVIRQLAEKYVKN